VAVTFDAVGPAGGAGANWVSGTTFSWTHVVSASATALLAGVTLGAASDTGLDVTCTAGGVPMADSGAGRLSPNANGFLRVFKLAAPPTGSVTVTVTISGTIANVSNVCGGSMSFLGSATDGTAFGVAASAQSIPAGSANPSMSATGAATSVLASFGGDGTASISAPTQTSRYIDNASSGNGMGAGMGQSAAGTGSAQTFGWTDAADTWAIITIEVKVPAAATSVPSPQPQYSRLRRMATRRKRQEIQFAGLGAPAVATATAVTGKILTNTGPGGVLLRVWVITGQAASPVGPNHGTAAFHGGSSTALTASVTTTVTGSRVYGALEENNTNTTVGAAAAGTTLVDSQADANAACYVTCKATAVTGTPGAATLGSTTGFTSGSVGLIEVLPGTGLAEDSSGPPPVWSTSQVQVTSAVFTPPPGSLLVAAFTGEGDGVNVQTVQVTDSAGLTWTQQVNSCAAGSGFSTVWTAVVPGGAAPAFSFAGAASATSAGGGATSFTVNVPAGTANGDFLVLQGAGYMGAGVWNLPSGWTQVYNQALTGSASHKFLLAWRVASSEPASYAVTCTATGWPSLTMTAYRGGAASSPVLGNALQTGSYVTTLPPPAYTEAQASSLLIYGFGGVNSANSGGTGLTLPSPSNLLAGSSTADINNASGGADLATLACTSGTGPGSATITTGVDECNWVLELAAGGGPVTQQGAASLSGTGAMTVAEVQQATVSLSGTGTLASAEVQQVTVSLSGTGTMTGAVVQRPGAALSGTGTLTAAPAVALNKAATLTDTFPGTSLSALWAASGTVAVNNQLTVTLPASTAAYSGIASAAQYDLTASSVVTQMPNAGNQSLASLEAYPMQLLAAGSGSNTLSWFAHNGVIAPFCKLAGTNTFGPNVSYVPATHQWFRIRESGGTIYWDTSPDAQGWTNQWSAAAPFSVTSVQVQLQAGTYASEATASAVVLGNVNALPGAASLSGTGAMAVAEAQRSTVALSGTGVMTQAEAQQPAVGLSGTGSMSQAEVQVPAAALSGTGTLTATGSLILPGAASLSGTGVMTATGSLAQQAAASLAGTGTLSTAVSWPAGASLSGTGALSAAVTQRPGASLAGTGVMVTAVTQQPGTSLTGSGVMSLAEVQAPAASLAGTGVLSVAEVQAPGASLSGSGAMTTSVGGQQTATASLSGTGIMTSAEIQLPGAFLSGTGVLSESVSIRPQVSGSGNGVLTTSVVTQPGASLNGAGALSAFVLTGPSVSASGTGTLTTSVGGQQSAAASLSGAGAMSVSETQGPGAALSGTGSLTAVTGGSQPGAASLSGTGSLSTAATQGPAVALAGSGAFSAAAYLIAPAGAALSGSGTLSAAPALFLRPSVALSGTGALTTTIGGTPVFDTDAVRIEDSEFAVLSDPDSATGTDAGEAVRISDTDSMKITEAETSAWPHDTDSVRVTEDGGWSGPVADLTPETVHVTEGGERIRLADADSAAAADAHLVQVWTYQPPFRWTGSEYALHYGDRVAWTGPRLDRAAFELADRLAQASTVEWVHDTDQASIADDERFGLLNVQLTVYPSLEVTLTIDA
jgi:hypothetical protein